MEFKNLDVKKYISRLFSQKNFANTAIVCGVLGVSLFLLSGFINLEPKKAEFKNDIRANSEQRRENLEKNLENIISNIKGAGNAKVLVTLENSTETIYATEERKNKEASEDKSSGEITRKKQSDDCEKKFITIKDSSGTEHALAVTEIEPKIKGVVVICPGGDDAIVKKRIVEATTTALNIASTRVCVTKSG